MTYKQTKFMTTGGQSDKTLHNYFNMPQTVMRNGQLVNISENNNRVFKGK